MSDKKEEFQLSFEEYVVHGNIFFYPPNNECNHEWKEYEGITQKYNYCVKCDIKKE